MSESEEKQKIKEKQKYMSELEEKQKIRKITDLLEKGGTMLANHHDCGAPMFRYMGKVVCPVCDTGGESPAQSGNGELAGKSRPEENPVPVSIEPVEKSQSRVTPTLSGMGIEIGIETQVLNRVHSLAGSIESETDLQRLRDKMECIELGIRILKLIKE